MSPSKFVFVVLLLASQGILDVLCAPVLILWPHPKHPHDALQFRKIIGIPRSELTPLNPIQAQYAPIFGAHVTPDHSILLKPFTPYAASHGRHSSPHYPAPRQYQPGFPVRVPSAPSLRGYMPFGSKPFPPYHGKPHLHPLGPGPVVVNPHTTFQSPVTLPPTSEEERNDNSNEQNILENEKFNKIEMRAEDAAQIQHEPDEVVLIVPFKINGKTAFVPTAIKVPKQEPTEEKTENILENVEGSSEDDPSSESLSSSEEFDGKRDLKTQEKKLKKIQEQQLEESLKNMTMKSLTNLIATTVVKVLRKYNIGAVNNQPENQNEPTATTTTTTTTALPLSVPLIPFDQDVDKNTRKDRKQEEPGSIFFAPPGENGK